MATSIAIPGIGSTPGFGTIPGGGSNLNPTGTFGTPTGGAGNYGYGNMNPTPIAVGTTGNTVSMNPGGGTGTTTQTGENGQTSGTQNPYGLTPEQLNRNISENQNYFGEGVGAELTNYINSGAGYNGALTQQAIDAQTNAMQQQIDLGANDLTSRLGAMGISGGSSSLPQALSQYYSQASTQENSIAAQEYYNMWNNSQQREMDMLQFVGQVNATGTANQPTAMDYLNEALGIAGSVATLGMG